MSKWHEVKLVINAREDLCDGLGWWPPTTSIPGSRYRININQHTVDGCEIRITTRMVESQRKQWDVYHDVYHLWTGRISLAHPQYRFLAPYFTGMNKEDGYPLLHSTPLVKSLSYRSALRRVAREIHHRNTQKWTYKILCQHILGLDFAKLYIICLI